MPAAPRSADVLDCLLTLWPDDPAGFRAACVRVTDWSVLMEKAARHGVLGVLAWPLLEEVSTLPAEVRKAIEQRRLAERLWADRLSQALGQVLEKLTDAAVQTVVLKGPILGERLYADPAARISTDLDLLIRPADLDRAIAALKPLDYRDPIGPASRYHRQFHHHLRLDRAAGPPVELHFRAFTGLGTEIGSREMLNRSTRYLSTSGIACSVVSAEDELLFLAVHAVGHGLARLIWLYDLKMWLRRYPEVRWPIVFSRARQWQVQAALAFALDILHRRLGTVSPSRKHRPSRRTARRLLDWSARCPESSRRGKLLAFLLQASLCDRPALSRRYLRHHFGRVLRRRLRQWLPTWTPEEWSG